MPKIGIEQKWFINTQRSANIARFGYMNAHRLVRCMISTSQACTIALEFMSAYQLVIVHQLFH